MSSEVEVSVYDPSAPGSTFKHLPSSDEVEEYCQPEQSFRKWNFILYESELKFAELQADFNTRRMRELFNLGTASWTEISSTPD